MLTIDVISEPLAAAGLTPNPDYADIDLQKLTDYDVSLVKPALLFADKVNLISYRVELQAAVKADAFRNSRMPMRYVCAYAGLTLRNDQDEIDQLGIPRNMLCSREDAEELFTDAPKFLVDFGRKYNDQIAEYQRLVARILRSRRDALLSDELDLAVSRNLLECSAWHVDMPNSFALNWSEVQEPFAENAVADLVHRLVTTAGVPLLEPGADLVIRNTLGHDQLVAERRHSALRAPVAVATAVTSSLPGLNELSVREIVDLRESLNDYLPAFRAAMIELSGEVAKQTDIDPQSLASEIDFYWQRDLAPVLQEISHEVSRARYPRKLLSALSSDKTTLAGTASAVALAAGSVFAGAGTLIPAAAAAAFPFVRALNDVLHSRDDVRKNRLYFLYELQKHISHRKN